MAEKEVQQPAQQFLPESNIRLRDIEEKQQILKDRVLLVGKSLVEERSKSFDEIQELKKDVIKLKQDNIRMKEIIERLSEQSGESARKEELMILQRQFDLFRKE